jgi:hypothetical protein
MSEYVVRYRTVIPEVADRHLDGNLENFWAATNRVKPLCSRREIARKAVTHIPRFWSLLRGIAQTTLEYSGDFFN